MANTYTADSLRKLNKAQSVAMVLSQRDEIKVQIESLRDEVKAMNTNFKKLEVDISIDETVSNLLTQKPLETE